MRNCVTRSFFSDDVGLARTCSTVHLTVRKIIRRIVELRKTTATLGLEHLHLHNEQRWKITRLPPCSQVKHDEASPTAGQSARPFVGEICSVLSSGPGRRRPSLVGIMSREEPEGETSLRSPHIKPSDCHYRLFSPSTSPTSTPPPPPPLSSSSCAWVKTPFLGLHDK